MISHLRRFLVASTLCCAYVLHAQTYTPKTIVFTGAPDESSSSLLAITGLTPGAPVTKQQVESALQKLGDTGMFSGISYTVNDRALTFTLTLAAGQSALPVRFTNFVWWTPEELTRDLEARVPLFHGTLAPNGTLADQVEAALVALAHEKGLAITVGVHEENGTGTLAISIDSPPILFGNLNVPDVHPLAGPTIADLEHGLHGEDFDYAINTGTILHDVASIYRNAGYLDVTVDKPVFTAPRKEGNGYAIDASAAVHPGSLYIVAAVGISAPSAFDNAALRQRTGLRVGDAVSPMLFDLAKLALTRSFTDRGYLAAKVDATSAINASAHTVSDSFTVSPGSVFHLARISVQAGLGDLGPALQHDKHLAAGVVADSTVMQTAFKIIHDHGDLQKVRIELVPNPSDNTASLVVSLRHALPPQGS